MNKKILVTGGAGYIGSHTVVELINSGYDILIVDDFSNSQPSMISGIESIVGKKIAFVELDLKDYKLSRTLFESYKFDAVIHFAASKAVGESVKLPLKYYRNNIQSILNLLELMDEFDVNNMVFSSSCTVYGQPDKLPVTEKTPLKKAESPYGNTKKISEDILKDAANANAKFQLIALRYFNPVGAHSSALIGELPIGIPNTLIPFITQTAAGMRDKLSVFGNDYNTPDGTAIRDYIHVVDLAKSHVIALERLLEKSNKHSFEYFNVGTGKGYSILEVIKTFEKVNDISLNYEITVRRTGDIEKTYADTTFANKELGWKAELGLEEMMTSAWEWQKQLEAKSLFSRK